MTDVLISDELSSVDTSRQVSPEEASTSSEMLAARISFYAVEYQRTTDHGPP